MAVLAEALTDVCPWIDPIRPGVLALPLRGPARYFGGEDAVVDRVGGVVTGSHPAPMMGVADGVFAASLAAAAGVTVPAGGTPDFLASWPVSTLAAPELADVLVRLGLRTLGDFAAVPAREVLARFGNDGVVAHRVAAGAVGELPGYRDPGLGDRLALLRRHVPLQNHQPDFWGGASDADERAAGALVTVQRQLGTDAVVVASVIGGRGPADRVRVVPWRPDVPTGGGDGGGVVATTGRKGLPPPAPWPGQLPPPHPTRVPAAGPPAEVHDRVGAPVGVTIRGTLTAPPARLSVSGRPWTAVTGWSTPWPVDEAWWSSAGRRSVRLQVATADGDAHLLVADHGRWRLEATYD